MNRAEDIFYLPLENAVESGQFSLGSTEFEPRGPVSMKSAARDPLPAAPPAVQPPPAPGPVQNQKSAAASSGQATLPSASLDQESCLNQLAALIANITEAFTVAIFLADTSEKVLTLGGLHTLSRDFIPAARIGFGCGLVGWTAEHAVRISVCPFEHDARTLLCYGRDQDLKSFIAVPILDAKENLLGVISCDSKKNYAFAKVTEKILMDCAAQAATVVSLIRKAASKGEQLEKPGKELLHRVIEKLGSFEDEDSLLQAVTEMPAEIVKRDAFVVVTTAEWGVGGGKFYSSVEENRMGHRLLEMVCKHKKIICGDRSVHALPVDDTKHRSFLSIPFHVLGREAGSFNLLSKPYEAFNAAQIAALEEAAKVVGKELERVRLREKFAGSPAVTEMMSWKHFSVHARSLLAEAQAQRSSLTLLRLSLRNVLEIEEHAGIEAASSVVAQTVRLAEQTVRAPAIACCLHGPQVMILAESSEAERIALRLRRLIDRINIADHAKDLRNSNIKLGALINKGLEIISARTPVDGTTLAELTAKSRTVLETAEHKVGAVANAAIR